MGLCLSAEEKDQKRQNADIDAGIKKDKKVLSKEVKLLILGTIVQNTNSFDRKYQPRLIFHLHCRCWRVWKVNDSQTNGSYSWKGIFRYGKRKF